MLKRYAYWLFDWDGCLGRTLEVWLAAYREGLAEFGATPDDQEIAQHFGDWQGATKLGVEPDRNDDCMQRIFQIGREHLGTVELYPGAQDLLQRLRAMKLPMALVTSSKREVIEKALAHNGIASYFEAVITAEDVTEHKPHPQSLELALEQIGGSADQAVLVGDSRKDLEAADNAGMDSILVYPPEHGLFYKLAELKKYRPTTTVKSFDELSAKLS